ncbi:LysR family transcriptional regulator [Roseibium marinum]|uniref:LysR family glycine cleavage system transcriptional activator n=1 Tax=Roseibium marinum TaxID=281252 RepID=A0A2S3UXA2_9HYPH|nr:LysR family transcriptional regulator [Roseibium marinum]POF32099.1 LysR family glycine cleavage system transcriptional activator [Roseibium marinum]
MSISPPVPRFPSLNALKAFEAAARLGGFAPAAEELHVTAGAVAAQIKSLEQEIGAALFVRQARGVSLTPLGQRALQGFIAAFDMLGEAVRDLKRDAAPQKVHIAALPALAQLWLAPRLPAVRERLDGIDISVTALERPPNLKRVPFDLCLFYGSHSPHGSIRFAEDELLPVCTPEVARALKKPWDLKQAVCLTDTAWAGDWSTWAEKIMPGEGFAPRGPVFSLYALALQEALSGAGVLMSRRALVAPYLASGALVAPFSKTAPAGEAISLWLLPTSRRGGAAEQVMEALQVIAGDTDT